MDPSRFLPLTPVAFEILLSLSDGARHGYAVMQAVNASSLGKTVHPGTLYRAIARMAERGLLVEEEEEGSDRRVYSLTPLGRAVAAEETGRLRDQVRRARGFVEPGRG